MLSLLINAAQPLPVIAMIINFRHQGLQQYYETGNGSRLPVQYQSKINRLLDQLDAVSSVSDIEQIGLETHKLLGDAGELWSIHVGPNYRIVLRIEGGNIYDVYVNEYH